MVLASMQPNMFKMPVTNGAAAEAEKDAFRRAHPVLAAKKHFMADGENSFSTGQLQAHDCKRKAIAYPLPETGQDSRELPVS